MIGVCVFIFIFNTTSTHFNIPSIQCESSSASLFLHQIIHQGRRLLGFIGHTFLDALSFDVNDIRQDRGLDSQNSSCRRVTSEMQRALRVRCYCNPAYETSREHKMLLSIVSVRKSNQTIHNGRWLSKSTCHARLTTSVQFPRLIKS